MRTFIQLAQGSPEWHEHRKSHRNASEVGAMMGESAWVSRYELWQLKTGRRVQEVTYPMKRGIALEPKARAAYERQTGNVMEPWVVTDELYSASLDGIDLAGELILEAKCPMKGEESSTWEWAREGKVVPCYYWQVQQQLMVSGAALAHFWVYDEETDTGVLVEVLPNLEDMALLREAWDRFMVLVETDTAPELTATDSVVRTDSEWQRAAELYVTSKKAAEEAAMKLEVAKADLIERTRHCNERGYGVSVTKYQKGNKQEVRVTVLKQEVETC